MLSVFFFYSQRSQQLIVYTLCVFTIENSLSVHVLTPAGSLRVRSKVFDTKSHFSMLCAILEELSTIFIHY